MNGRVFASKISWAYFRDDLLLLLLCFFFCGGGTYYRTFTVFHWLMFKSRVWARPLSRDTSLDHFNFS